MRKLYFLLLCMIFGAFEVNAQMGINADGSRPDSSSMLDIKSNKKGLLMPRMSSASRDSIFRPAKGLLLFNLDDNQFNMNQGTPENPVWVVMNSQWISAGAAIYYTTGNVGIGNTNPLFKLDILGDINFTGALRRNGDTLNFGGITGITASNPLFSSGGTTPNISIPQAGSLLDGFLSSTDWNNFNNKLSSQWKNTGNDIYFNTGSVVIGSATPDNSAALDVKSTEKGFLPPRMSKLQRDQITDPAEGLIVYCNDCGINGAKALTIFTNGSWTSFGNNCPTPAPPSASTHVPSANQIIWNWNPVTDAIGYKWSTTYDYSTAIDNGENTSRTETGLACNTNYIRYIWAYNACGMSTAVILSQTTSLNPPPSPVAGTNVPYPFQISWNWNQVVGATGYKWSMTNDYATALDAGNNTTYMESGLNCNTPYSRYVWSYSNCGVSSVTLLTQTTSMYPPSPVTAGTNISGPTEIEWHWNIMSGAAGYKWNTMNDYGTATDVGNNTFYLETGLSCFTPYTRYVWVYNSCGVSTPTTLTQSTAHDTHPAPVPGTNIPGATQVQWNWTGEPHSTGYKWNSVNNLATAIDLGLTTTYLQTGLNCNTNYNAYVWAYDNCALSDATLLIQTTSMNPPSTPSAGTNIPFKNMVIWNWNQVSGAAGYKWNTVNDYGTATDMGTTTSKTESGLNCNTPYQRFVWAYSSCGISTSATLAETTLLDPPSAPAAGTQIASSNEIEWHWNAVSGATGYKWSTTDNYSSAIDLGSNLLYLETGLSCLTPYTRYVWSYNSCGYSSSTTLSQSTTQDTHPAPGAGTHIPSPTQIVWNWNSVPSSTGYKWNTTTDYNTATDVGLNTTYTQTGLTCNTLYVIYAWAYDYCGHSSPTMLTQTTSMNPPSSPVAGTNVPAPTQITWNWNTVTGATGYKWNTVNNYLTAIDIGTGTSRTETGLTCNTGYTRYVWTYNNCGVSTTPTSLTQTTSLDPPAAPTAGTHVAAADQITWKWNTVTGATGYKWNNTNSYATAIDMGTTLQRIQTGLNCNTAYTSYVWAYSNCGVSTVTTLSKTTALDPPDPPTAATHVPSATQIIWNWNAGNDATGYKWNTTNNYSTAIDAGNTLTHTETSLTCNTAYTRYIWSYSSCGVSGVVTLTQSTSLNPPASPVAGTHSAFQTLIIWNWNTVSGATGYKWNTTNNYATAIDMGTNVSRTETSLTCNTPYTRFVWAYSNCGVSAATTLTQSTALDPPPSPSAGTNIPDSYQVTWNWNTVSLATGYKWNTVNDQASAIDVGNTTSHLETGLNCNTAYTRYAWAYNNCGVSVSVTLSQTTSLDPPDSPLAGSNIPSTNQVVWNWGVVTEATGYKWNTTNNYATASDLGNSTSKTESGLNCNTAYARYVWAYNFCGVSEFVQLNQTTLLDPPPAPTAGSNVPYPTQITWNWNTVPVATGYKWNTTDDFQTASEMGTSTSKTETGLSCNTPYLRYVWAYSICGVSTSMQLSQTTSMSPPSAPTAGTHVPTSSQIQWNWTPVSGATGYKWNTVDDYNSAMDIGPNTSKLQSGLSCNTGYTSYAWAYSNCGISQSVSLSASTTVDPPAAPVANGHIPASTQITWIWYKVPGVAGYKWATTNSYANAIDMGTDTSRTETGLACNTAYIRYVWSYSSCGVSNSATLASVTTTDPPPAPTAGTNVPSANQIIWNWNSVPGVAGYKWNTTDDYNSASDVGNSTTKTEAGLSCNTSYTRYVWSYSSCGVSVSLALTQTTALDPPPSPTAGTHEPGSTQIVWNWNTVSSATGYKWNTTNSYTTAIDVGNTTTTTETGLSCNTAYTRYVWSYNNCGTSTSSGLTATTTTCPFACGNTLTDSRDNQTYPTIQIGTQCWLGKNLNVGSMITGTVAMTNNGIIEKYCYGNSSTNCDTYGGLYQWDEMMAYTTTSNANPSGRPGICPSGWHIPSDAEWCEMSTYIDPTVNCSATTWSGTDAGGKLKETGTAHWNTPNTGATNATSFTALPAGYRVSNGNFTAINVNNYLSSSTEAVSTTAYYRNLYYNYATIARGSNAKGNGYAVRCVKD